MASRLLKDEDKMKLLVSLNNKTLDDYLKYTNSFIIGLKGFSINYLEFSVNEIKELLNKYSNIELFVSINKNMFNDDLELLEQELRELNKLDIKGIMFYDLSVLSIVKRLNLNINLVWHQGHMVTNYNTCNYYYDKGCKYAYLATEITVDEIKEIKEKSPISLMAFLFGNPIVSFSKRKLLSNYEMFSDTKLEGDYQVINSLNSSDYFVKENNHGTSIVYGNTLNGIRPMNDLMDTLSYGILDENFIEHDLFIKVLEIYNKFLNNEISVEEAEKLVYDLTGSLDTIFFYKKTIYKVKDEKKN